MNDEYGTNLWLILSWILFGLARVVRSLELNGSHWDDVQHLLADNRDSLTFPVPELFLMWPPMGTDVFDSLRGNWIRCDQIERNILFAFNRMTIIKHENAVLNLYQPFSGGTTERTLAGSDVSFNDGELKIVGSKL